MRFGGTYWSMDNNDARKDAVERYSDTPYQHSPPPPYNPFNMAKMVEMLIPVVLASAITGAATVAVIGERLAMCKLNIESIQHDLRELRRDLYRPHNMHVPYFFPNRISEQEHDA